MHRVVDDTHIIIFKSIAPFFEDNYYHKMGRYSIVVQIVDCNKRFLIFVLDCLGMPMILKYYFVSLCLVSKFV